MSFTWKNRRGDYLVLTGPEPITTEIEDISLEIDGLIDAIENPEPAVRDHARAAISPLQARLVQLAADRDRWNRHAHQLNQTAAAKIVTQIEALPERLEELLVVVALHGEHELLVDRTAGALDERAAILAGAPTDIQRRAVAHCTGITPPPDGASRAEMKAWLDAQPRFARQPHADNGWFAWIDRHGAAHRLVDSLFIESEVAAIVGELGLLRPQLQLESPPDALFLAIEEGSALMEHLTNLQGDLERFQREADARDLVECQRYAADWRSKRKTS